MPNTFSSQHIPSTSYAAATQSNTVNTQNNSGSPIINPSFSTRPTNIPMSPQLRRQLGSNSIINIARIPNPWEVAFANRPGNHFSPGPSPSPMPQRYRSENIFSEPIVRNESPETIDRERSRSAHSSMHFRPEVSPIVPSNSLAIDESDYVPMNIIQAVREERALSGMHKNFN